MATVKFYNTNPVNENLININSLPNNWGKILAHERGHLAYIIPLHLKYMKWLADNGYLNNPAYNTHNSNDPSVKESREYENNYIFNIKN